MKATELTATTESGRVGGTEDPLGRNQDDGTGGEVTPHTQPARGRVRGARTPQIAAHA